MDAGNGPAHRACRGTGKSRSSPEKYHATLFDKFTEAHRPGLREKPSVGLGMSVIKTIVKWHGGKIWLESEENQGSTFFIEIPRPA